jgi:hypothetical protein
MRWLFIMPFLLFTVTPAQSYQIVPNTEVVVDQIDQTVATIYLAAPTLTSPSVADALRRAIVERGVTVYVITTSQGLSHLADATNSLALLDAHVYVGDIPQDYFLLVLDETTVMSGPLVAASDLEPSDLQTISVTDTDNAKQYAALLRQMMAEPNRYQFTSDLRQCLDQKIAEANNQGTWEVNECLE